MPSERKLSVSRASKKVKSIFHTGTKADATVNIDLKVAVTLGPAPAPHPADATVRPRHGQRGRNPERASVASAPSAVASTTATTVVTAFGTYTPRQRSDSQQFSGNTVQDVYRRADSRDSVRTVTPLGSTERRLKRTTSMRSIDLGTSDVAFPVLTSSTSTSASSKDFGDNDKTGKAREDAHEENVQGWDSVRMHLGRMRGSLDAIAARNLEHKINMATTRAATPELSNATANSAEVVEDEIEVAIHEIPDEQLSDSDGEHEQPRHPQSTSGSDLLRLAAKLTLGHTTPPRPPPTFLDAWRHSRTLNKTWAPGRFVVRVQAVQRVSAWWDAKDG